MFQMSAPASEDKGSPVPIPSARELVHTEMLHNISTHYERLVFDDVFKERDDETFWKIINLIEGSGLVAGPLKKVI